MCENHAYVWNHKSVLWFRQPLPNVNPSNENRFHRVNFGKNHEALLTFGHHIKSLPNEKEPRFATRPCYLG